MKVISNNYNYYKELKTLSKNRLEYFYIATFNIKLDKDIYEILNNLTKNKCKDVKILIGLNNPSLAQINFLKKELSKFKNVEYRLFINSHLKMLVTNKKSIIGGRNLTKSEWKDVGVEFINKVNINKLKVEFLKNFNSRQGLI